MRELDSAPFPFELETPRIYRFSPGWKWFMTLGSAVLIPLFAWLALQPLLEPGQRGAWVLSVISVPMLALFVVGTMQVWRSRVVLRGDTIELVELGAPRRLRMADIEGVRIQQTQNVTLVLVPRQRGVKPMKLGSYFRFDAAFERWLDALPNLDAADTERKLQEIAVAPELGRNEGERLERLERARRFAKPLSLAGFAVSLWAMFFPRPYMEAIAVTAAVPLLALLVLFRGRGLWRVDEDKNDPHPSVFVPLCIPGLALALRALLDFQLVEVRQALEPAGVGAMALIALLLIADRSLRAKRWFTLILLPFVAAYSWGLVVTVNGTFDHSRPEVFSVQVLDKHVSSGKQTTYNLRLAPWGPLSEPEQVAVPRHLYERTEPGDEVQVELRPGRLGVPWYTVATDG
jgi:hypothetical protein